jgi:two-component system, cell cycle sensor histidine kinase and response regulator CckA
MVLEGRVPLFPTNVVWKGQPRRSARKMLQKHKTILLIDDETSQRTFMRRVLEDAGYNVLEGADYDEALVVHSQHKGKIDVLLTDISLPGRNGYELAKALLAIDPGLNAIFVSGLAGAEACRFHGMATTDVHFLEKPFNAADLLRRVRCVLKAGGPYLTRTAG